MAKKDQLQDKAPVDAGAISASAANSLNSPAKETPEEVKEAPEENYVMLDGKRYSIRGMYRADNTFVDVKRGYCHEGNTLIEIERNF